MNDIKLTIGYTKKLNILYVEDDETLLNTTKTLFENYFNNIDTAVDGNDGYEKYVSYKKEHNEYYDLVITDINMPKLNGIGMSEKILLLNSVQPIIIATAHNENEFLLQAIELGISGFITKPLINTKLVNALYRVAKSIDDRKFVETHLEKVEKLNTALLVHNKKLKKSLRMLDTVINKENIVHPQKDVNEVDGLNSEKHIAEQINELINNDFDELKEILIEIDLFIIEIIDDITLATESRLPEFSKLFARFSAILSYYTLFEDLSYSMNKFTTIIKESPLPKDPENVKNIFMLLESFIYMLNKWQNDIEDGNKFNKSIFNSSMISDLNMISNMWLDENSETTIEGIFDFE